MTEFEQLKVVQDACHRVKEALTQELKAKGTVLVTVMDEPLLYAIGKTQKMITSGRGDYFVEIKVFDGNAWITYLIAGNSPKSAVIKALEYACEKNVTDAELWKRIDKFRVHIYNYLNQQAIVVKQEGILPSSRVVFACDLEVIE